MKGRRSFIRAWLAPRIPLRHGMRRDVAGGRIEIRCHRKPLPGQERTHAGIDTGIDEDGPRLVPPRPEPARSPRRRRRRAPLAPETAGPADAPGPGRRDAARGSVRRSGLDEGRRPPPRTTPPRMTTTPAPMLRPPRANPALRADAAPRRAPPRDGPFPARGGRPHRPRPVPEPRDHLARIQPPCPERGRRRTDAAPRAREVPRHRELEPRRVLHEAHRRPQAAGRGGRAIAHRRRPHPAAADRRSPGGGRGDRGAQGAHPPRGAGPPRGARDRSPRPLGAEGGGARCAPGVLRREHHAPGDAAGHRPGPSLPLHLEPLAQPAGDVELQEGGIDHRPRQGADRRPGSRASCASAGSTGSSPWSR